MKIISVIITPPKYFASGAITAAEKLSKETSYLCNLDLAIMSNKDLIKKNNNFNKYYFKCRNKLIGLHHILPYSIKNAFWTSNIFNFIKKNKPDLVHFHNPIPPLAFYKL